MPTTIADTRLALVPVRMVQLQFGRPAERFYFHCADFNAFSDGFRRDFLWHGPCHPAVHDVRYHIGRDLEDFMKRPLIVCLGLLLAVVAVAAQKPKYGVTVTADRKTDFNAFKSYSWDTASWPALDKNVNQQIVDAVDRELKGLGLEKRESGPTDIQLRYGAQRRNDSDPHAKAPATNLPTYVVGTLVVVMRESANGKEVYRARVDKPIDLAPDKIKATVDEVVAEMFAKYPTRTRK
jgi:hypothetical protein